MARKASSGPTERELDILNVLWEHGELNVRGVHERLSHKEKLSFNSVQTILQIMFDKGHVERELHGRSYSYRAKRSQRDVQTGLLLNLLDRAFGGSAKSLISRALEVKWASPTELEEISQLLDEARHRDA